LDPAISKGYTRGKGEVEAIKIPKGTKIMYLRKHSEYPNHLELVIPDNYKLKLAPANSGYDYIIV